MCERRLGLALVALLAAAGFVGLTLSVVRGHELVVVDGHVATWVSGNMPVWAEWLARPFTWLGGPVAVIVASVIVGLALELGGRRADAALVLSIAVVVNILVWSSKALVDRARPDAGSAIPLPHSASFPSGHAANGIALGGALGIIASARASTAGGRAAWVAGGLCLGLAVGASRVVLNVHYVTDVLAGFCLGLAVLSAAVLVRCLGGDRRG